MLPKEIEAKYAAQGTLGSGAMGTVYDAMDRVIERRVAVKVVRRPAAGDPEGEEAHARFRREAQAAGRLSHPNIVGVYDYGENADSAWIVMEIVEGGSLKGRLDRGERLPVPEIVRVMEQVLAALAYSHGRGVVHRDIKPANIMLASDGTVKLADFGIARIENSSMTQVGTVMGTPSYMAPEQLRGETVDARADLWAAGVVLYQLLTGEKPFEGGFSAVMHKALNTEPTPPSALSVTAPRAFDAVVARVMAKRPEDRFASAAAMAEAVRAAAVSPVGFAGAGPLPGLDSDATMVAGPATVPPVSRPAAPIAPPPPAKRGASPALLAGGGAALVAAGVAAFLLLGGDGGEATRRAEQIRVEAARDADAAAERVAAQERERVADEARRAEQARTGAEAASTEAARAEAERARRAADARAAEDDRRATEAQAARLAAEVREEQARQDAARRQQTEVARRAAEERAREETARAEAARAEAERTRIAAEQARAEAAARAREEAQRAEAARLAALRVDYRAAAAAAAAAAPCALIGWSAHEQGLSLSGVVRRGGERAIQAALTAQRVPPGAAQLRLAAFDGPYCAALDALRPVAAPGSDAPQLDVHGVQPLVKGDLLRFSVTLPAWPGYLTASYLTSSGEVAHLVLDQPEAAGSTVRLGDPRAGFPGWEVDEPFGTDLLLVFASDRPLFRAARPQVERLDDWLAALQTALRAPGARLGVRAAVLETAARR